MAKAYNGRGGRRPNRPVTPGLPDNSLEGRRAFAIELRKGGFTYREIGEKMGVTSATAHSYVQAALLELREKTEMDVQSVRDLELERCDRLLRGLWTKACKGDASAVTAAIRVLERRSRMLGLDAPVRSEWIGALTGVTPETVARMSETDIAERVKALMGRVAQAAVIDVDGKVE